MSDGIYSTTGTQNVSSVCLQHTVVREVLNINQIDDRPDKQYSAIIAATGGNTIVISGVAERHILVDSYLLSASGAGSVRFLSSTGTYLTGLDYMAANGSISVSENANLLTKLGENLVLNTTSTVGGHITYRLV